ncbi:MAG: hypothetical protein M3O34_13945 [Chloroflexota bacterium]|nr:hypothetical protein [Chloroflexota bacterium]
MVGERFTASFQRTLRIPDDGREYPLPPGLGRFPLLRVADYAERLPADWGRDDLFLPMYQREALWLGFDGATWKPNAVKVGIGGVNAVSGGPWDDELHADPQDYLVCPDQPWLDGINVGDGRIRQFVAMPLGAGYAVEAQVTGAETVGGIQLLVFEPKPGRFPDQPPPAPDFGPMMAAPAGPAMGLGAGGVMRQKIYPDEYGIDTWDPNERGGVVVHILNSEWYRALTGREPPPTPISAATYAQYGLPWFDLYDESRATLAGADRLRSVKSVDQRDAERGLGDESEPSLNVEELPVRKLTPPDNPS